MRTFLTMLILLLFVRQASAQTDPDARYQVIRERIQFLYDNGPGDKEFKEIDKLKKEQKALYPQTVLGQAESSGLSQKLLGNYTEGSPGSGATEGQVLSQLMAPVRTSPGPRPVYRSSPRLSTLDIYSNTTLTGTMLQIRSHDH